MDTKDGEMDKNAQDARPHLPHTFEWCLSGKQATSITCNMAGTVEDALRQSLEFRRAEKMDKELVIVRDGQAISSHFPCNLIGNERLTLKYVKPAKKQKQHGNISKVPGRKGQSGEPVVFHLLTRGGKNVTKILKNPAINNHVQKISVYAYKGETVKQALRRDGRIQIKVIKKNCALSEVCTEVNTEFANLVDDLHGKSYKIILLNKFSPPHSQHGSLEEDYIIQSESQKCESDENQDPQQSAETVLKNDRTTEEKQKANNNATPEKTLSDISNSNKAKHSLSSKLKHSQKGKKTKVSKLSCIQNFLRVEYGKSAQTSTEVKTMKKLMKLSDYVCQVRINGIPTGCGFLLFDKFVLTNAHVVKNVVYKQCKLDTRVTVNFSHESLDQTDGTDMNGGEMVVEEVPCLEYCQDASRHMFDWALLRLSDNHKLPDGLLKHFGYLPQSGRIWIIGHPNCGVKKIDPCIILSPDFHSQLLNDKSMSGHYYRHLLTYLSCFYFGSSGSPVFDEHCRVVAMHSGGYPSGNENDNNPSAVEYGYPLSLIMEHIIVQIVQKRRFDVLKAYLACKYAHQENMMENVKKLVESRNITAFKNVTCSEIENDESLKCFFDFFSMNTETVSMDINNA